MGGSGNLLDSDKEYDASNSSIRRKRVHLLTIGIGEFDDNAFSSLESYTQLNQFKKVSEDYLRLSYSEHPEPTFLNKRVNLEKIHEALKYLCNTVGGEDVVIISILSHGEIVNDEYYLVCTDTQSNDYPNTAISGKKIRSYMETMANKGAVVIVFVDTCNASALFDKAEGFKPSNNGSIAYFASSLRGQKAKEIDEKCYFTDAVLKIFLNQAHALNELEFATIKTFQNTIENILGNITEANSQTPATRIFSQTYDFQDFPIIKKQTPDPYGTIWQKPKPFSPIAVSPKDERSLDYVLIGIEGMSLAGMIVTGPVLQTYYRHQIDKETNMFARNDYRQKGKNSSIGFCVSAGAFITSYTLRALHVHNQLKIEHKEKQYATLDVNPVSLPDYNGFALVLNF